MLAVIAACYEAALDESLWPTALNQFAEVTESQAASFWVLESSEAPRLTKFICINVDPAAIKEYLEYAAAIDPTVQYLAAHPEQAVVHDGLVISEREKDKHPYYNWHERLIDTRFRMVGQARLGASVQAGVGMHRTKRAGRYERRDIERFTVLHRHLERALAVGIRIGSLGAMEQFGRDWLDSSDSAVLLLDDQKRILRSNRAALTLESKHDGVRLTSHGIELANKDDDARLQSLIDQALSSSRSGARSSGGNMRARRPSGKRAFPIFVISVSRDYPVLALHRPAVCVVVTDPEDSPALPTQRIQDAFSLTEAEAKLASLLADGEDLRSAADKLQVTYGTARARLAEIFQKTETRRQAELVRLLVTSLTSR